MDDVQHNTTLSPWHRTRPPQGTMGVRGGLGTLSAEACSKRSWPHLWSGAPLSSKVWIQKKRFGYCLNQLAGGCLVDILVYTPPPTGYLSLSGTLVYVSVHSSSPPPLSVQVHRCPDRWWYAHGLHTERGAIHGEGVGNGFCSLDCNARVRKQCRALCPPRRAGPTLNSQVDCRAHFWQATIHQPGNESLLFFAVHCAG